MMGLEKLLQSMTGLTPEEMKGAAEQGIAVLKNLDQRMQNIERMLIELHSAQCAPSDALLIEHKETA